MILSFHTLADNLLRLPELKGFEGVDFDSAEANAIQREIFRKKKILGILYQEYCRPFVESANRAPKNAKMLEIGSGTSPLKEAIPGLLCSDLVVSPWLDIVASAYALPFRDNSLDRIFLMFVCHHLGKIETFLEEAFRCLKPGGEMVIIDPAITLFSKPYYTYIHVDNMDIQAKKWGFEGTGRLSDSNIALAWMIFFRDRDRFQKLYPDFIIEKVEYSTCLSFLLSGGLRIRQLMPTRVISTLFAAENWFIRHASHQIAVTMALTIRKK
jgi:SAM-dependent methyltransferase